MRHLTLAFLLLPATASADGVYRRETEVRREIELRTRACGGDAFSFAEVAEGALAHRGGPLVSVPDTLCADLAPRGPPAIGSIAVYPSIGAGAQTPSGREEHRGARRPGPSQPLPAGGIRGFHPHIGAEELRRGSGSAGSPGAPPEP